MSLADKAIDTVRCGQLSFSKFFSANDTGATGSHQTGIYIPKPSISILFDHPCKRGNNQEKWVRIRWQDDFETYTRFIYYGQGTRNEYRITSFGKDFPYFSSEYTGALFVLTRLTDEDYRAYVLNSDEEINHFLNTFGLTPAETNCLIDSSTADDSAREKKAIDEFISGLTSDFPSSDAMASAARRISSITHRNPMIALKDPDKALLQWTDQEYRLFHAIENARYGKTVASGFKSVDDFEAIANQVLNRRKSRAGKSLEHHLASLFDEHHIMYTAQAVTEGNKRPDFIFPSETAYHDFSFPVSRLTSLAAKTTCKDRWRQILNEADRLRDGRKYLCTLQQGISVTQMDEMESERVTLVIPKPYISTYPADRRDRIWTIRKFVEYVREKQLG